MGRMWKRFVRLLSRLSLTLLSISALSLLLPRLITALSTAWQVYSPQSVPRRGVAIVFGAGLWQDGSPTPVLKDRVATAAQLYFDGKVQKLLMSGDNRFLWYNEPGAMRQYALSLGVPDEDIVLDYAGRRTYDTCYRAKEIFGLSQAILVTQAFHLPRALYICQALGLDAVGVPAEGTAYRRSSLLMWNLRELPATLAALWQVHISHPRPILGDPEPIFPHQAQ